MTDRAQTPNPEQDELNTDELEQVSGGAIDSYLNVGSPAADKWIEVDTFSPNAGKVP